jgi:hypothetical protein
MRLAMAPMAMGDISPIMGIVPPGGEPGEGSLKNGVGAPEGGFMTEAFARMK